MLDIAKKDTKNAVVEERLQMAATNTSKIMSELRDESNAFSIFNRSFPLVGCDRKAPPAKVGVTMTRDRLNIAAYANGDVDTTPSNTMIIEWNEINVFKSQKDGLQVFAYFY